MPGIPVVYYGEEIGLMGSCDPDNRRPMRFGSDVTEQEEGLLISISNLNKLRSKYPALSLGDTEVLYAKGPLLLILKSYLGSKIIIVINNGDNEEEIHQYIPYGSLKNLITKEDIYINDDKFDLYIEPYSHLFFKVGR